MNGFARTDRSLLSQWWWTVDRYMLAGIAVLAFVGIVMVLASSPAIARKLDMSSQTFFIVRHLTFLVPASLILLVTSLLTPRGVLRLGIAMLGVFGLLLLVTLFVAPEIKGARRWLFIAGFQIQPSEFVKPALAVVAAWFLARFERLGGLPEALAVVGPVMAVLLLQPDLGMTVLTLAVFSAQMFVAGMGWLWIATLVGVGALGLIGAYTSLPHVQERIDGFLDPTIQVEQVDRAMRAVASGGLFGRGPGEGEAKFHLPEAHSDFVFATAVEEYGALACLLIIATFAFIVLRGLNRIASSGDRFVQLAATGLIVLFGLQAMINMAVNLNLMPTKGMTLPFISYGGSSLLALAFGMGMLLALTRRHAHLR